MSNPEGAALPVVAYLLTSNISGEKRLDFVDYRQTESCDPLVTLAAAEARDKLRVDEIVQLRLDAAKDRREIASLRAELEQQRNGNAKLLDGVSDVVKDANRYRYLRFNAHRKEFHHVTADMLDEAIDSAIRALGEGKPTT